MKLIYLLITVAVLAACGGGGGVDMQTPTDTEQPPTVDPAVAELMTQLNAARAQIEGIPAAEQLKLRIDALEDALANATATIEALKLSLADILQEIQNIKSSPNDMPTDETPNDMPTDETPNDMPTDETPNDMPTDETPNDMPTDETPNDMPTDETPNDMPTDETPEPTPSAFDTVEYQANPMYEILNPLYAYDRGYFGKGVTVAVIEYRSDFNVAHPDLAANYVTVTIDGILHYRVTGIIVPDTAANIVDDDHASRVAGLIGATRNSVGMHGIAPEVKMIPFSASKGCFNCGEDGGYVENQLVVGQYIRDNHIPIVNNSWGGGDGGPPLAVRLTTERSMRNARQYNDVVGDSDTIWVWAAGNLKLGYTKYPNTQAYYPHFHTRLEKNWLVAIAVDSNMTIANFSSVCGEAKDWCVATGVYRAYTPNHDEANNEYGYRRGGAGTSFAAPQVSGALAIFYGAIGMDSPQLARAILLTTATDLGDEGVDDIYGWGLVNISAGIVMIENMKSAGTEEFSAVPFANLRGELPSGFAHLHNELSAIKLAIKLTTDLYYNVPLSEMLTPGNAKATPLGDAAAEMLENRGEETRRGIFAYGDINQELGIRYYGGGNGYSYIAEGNQSATNNFSGNFGGIGKISGKTYNGKLGFTKAVKANMQIFADYERAKIIGKGEEGNIIKGARNARAESWTAGISFADIWKYGDKIRLSANQEMKLSGGELIVRYPHAVGDFHETFIGESTQEIEVREAFLPLKQKALMLYTAGYSQKFTAKSEWAAALEYNAGNNAKALSLIWQGEF